jgi:photosystem I P700 chlorophyll a apoprotein A2
MRVLFRLGKLEFFYYFSNIFYMVTNFPVFNKSLRKDPTTRRWWYGVAISHDFEGQEAITEEHVYQKIFASHFGQLALIFLWTSGNIFHVAYQGNFEAWIQDPLHIRPVAHAIQDPHYGQLAIDAYTKYGTGPVNVATSGVYEWWYTIGIRSNYDLYRGSCFCVV